VIKPDPNRTLDFLAVRRALASEGVRPGKMRIRARGEVESGSEGTWFRIAGWPEPYPLSGGDLSDGPASIHAAVRFASGKPQLTLLKN
jgi:hypothetical protein